MTGFDRFVLRALGVSVVMGALMFWYMMAGGL